VIQTPEASINVTISSGLAVTCEGDDAASLLARADEALYASKENGRNCSHFHNSQTCDLIKLKLKPSDPVPAAIPPGQGIETDDETDAPADQLGPDLEAVCKELQHRLNDFADPR
jgi:hypothetical protein